MPPISSRARSRPADTPAPPRTERDAALDRIQEIRAVVAGKSLWMKRASVGSVTIAVAVGAFQGWMFLQLLAVPFALAAWWFDAQLTRADARLEHLYEAVFSGDAEPPLPGDEEPVAGRLARPPLAMRRALLSGPGAGLHFMMVGVAIVLNFIV